MPVAQLPGSKDGRMRGEDLLDQRGPGTRHTDDEYGTLRGDGASHRGNRSLMAGDQLINLARHLLPVISPGMAPGDLVGALIAIEGQLVVANVVIILADGVAQGSSFAGIVRLSGQPLRLRQPIRIRGGEFAQAR